MKTMKGMADLVQRERVDKILAIVESVLNVVSGFVLSLLFWQHVIAPLMGFEVSMHDNLIITGCFTIFSIIRGYFWRRIFQIFDTRIRKYLYKKMEASC